MCFLWFHSISYSKFCSSIVDLLLPIQVIIIQNSKMCCQSLQVEKCTDCHFWIFVIQVICFRASRIRDLGTHFFVHLMTCLHTRLCTSQFVYLMVSFGHTCTLTCTSPCINYKDKNVFEQKVNLRVIPLTINSEPSLGIKTVFLQRKKQQKGLFLARTKQPDNFQSTVFESKEHGWSIAVFFGLRQQGCQ